MSVKTILSVIGENVLHLLVAMLVFISLMITIMVGIQLCLYATEELIHKLDCFPQCSEAK